MIPDRPNSTIADSARANGGLTIGSSAMTCMKRLRARGSGTRTWTNANRKPTSVPTVATSTPRMIVLKRIWFCGGVR